ncbi:phage holin family protein [Alkaliphilus crotonatoxidans]
MSEERRDSRTANSNGWISFIIRFIVSAIVISVAAFLTPGFSIRGMGSILLAAAIISLIDYLIFRIAKFDASPFGRGITGFIVAAIVLYATQYFVPAMRVTPLGAILGALVIGIIDAIIPGKTF